MVTLKTEKTFQTIKSSFCLNFINSFGVQQNKTSFSEMTCAGWSLAQSSLLRGGTGDDLPAFWRVELFSLHCCHLTLTCRLSPPVEFVPLLFLITVNLKEFEDPSSGFSV